MNEDGTTTITKGETKTTEFHMWSFMTDQGPLYIFTVTGKPEYSNMYHRLKSANRVQVQSSMMAVVATHDALLWNATEPVQSSEEAIFTQWRD